MRATGTYRHGVPLLAAIAMLALPPRDHADPVRLPSGAELADVSFERHVASLLGRLGCSSGACHGSFQGKGGFHLSLFGYSQQQDYLSLTRDGMGRRINAANPDQSLMLLKPTGQVPHGGGKRLEKDSWQYRVIREWIAQGAKCDAGAGAVRHVEVSPKEHLFNGPGESIALAVTVEFADDTRADMTPFCEFRVKDDSVAESSPSGEVRALRPGDTAVVISYRGNLVTARAFVPVPVRQEPGHQGTREANFVDREVFAKLRKLGMLPSETSSDTEFLRRVTIDTIGCLPSPDEVRAFLADAQPDKRCKKIEALLAHPMHAALWATRFCDITGNNIDAMEGPAELRPKRAKMWHDWFRKRVAENMPYDQMVRGVLCATSRDGLDVARWIDREIALDRAAHTGFESDYASRPSLDLFWRRMAGDDFFPLEQMAELTAAAFLGVRIECAQCHKHPFDRWTQVDYRAFANVFGQTRFDSSPELRAAVDDLLAQRRQAFEGGAGGAGVGPPIPRLREVYVSKSLRRLPHPELNGPLEPRALGGPELKFDGDAREQLCNWLVQPNNPFFARNFVNRIWAHYLGIGLVEPVDAFSVANPPSNERLLDALAADFVEHGYDMRQLERTILSSQTYQLSSAPNATNEHDRNNFSHAYVRPMMAEVVVDVLHSALGVAADFGPQVPAGSRAIEIAPSRVQDPRLAHVFRVFGRPLRATSCDCERSREPAVPQSLFLMSDQHLLNQIGTGRLTELLAEHGSDETAIDELFLATLSRFPRPKEKSAAVEHVANKQDRRGAFVDIAWALVNTREFILNH
ncbi:MAG: DUF1553 domain-containing protein [Planctomycetes bacterium]|nr:DUF1553 domain-containing protein [Planctomycetota bacterium]